jgi:hypothetical protein
LTAKKMTILFVGGVVLGLLALIAGRIPTFAKVLIIVRN